MKKSGKIALAALGFASTLAFASNKICDIAIKRPEKSGEPAQEIYIRREELRRINNQVFYDYGPEDVSIKSVSGHKMRAWYLPAEKPANRFVICVHGYKCNGPDEFSHMMPFYHEDMGYNILLPDLTAHGRSEGKYIGFGSFDAKNILLWVDYLINRFGEDIEIILHGLSMGAATVMNCNEMSPPDQVKLIIEDCGFISAADEINETLKDMIGFKCMPIVWLGGLASKVKAGYFFTESNPLKNMDKAKNPVLFIHGEKDTYVPFKFGKMLYDACPTPKDYLWVPDTIHVFSYYNARDEYQAKIRDFVAKYLDNRTEKVI